MTAMTPLPSQNKTMIMQLMILGSTTFGDSNAHVVCSEHYIKLGQPRRYRREQGPFVIGSALAVPKSWERCSCGIRGTLVRRTALSPSPMHHDRSGIRSLIYITYGTSLQVSRPLLSSRPIPNTNTSKTHAQGPCLSTTSWEIWSRTSTSFAKHKLKPSYKPRAHRAG